MKIKSRIIVFTCLFIPFIGFCQEPIVHSTDSLGKSSGSMPRESNLLFQHGYDSSVQPTPKLFFNLLLKDFKDEFTRPFHLQGKDWGNLAKYAVVGGALAFLDGPIQREATLLVKKNPDSKKISKTITDFGGSYEVAALAAFGAGGAIFKNRKMQTVTMLSAQAYITSSVLTNVVKVLTGRTRPSYYAEDVKAKATFLGPFSKETGSNGSFPSGHTTVAFAVATVFALEYSNKPWIPILAYSSDSLIGLSRIYENKHWATDVFVGALVGFLSGRTAVKNYHHLAKLKADERKKAKPVSFNLQYNNGHLMPGLTWYF